MAPYPNSMWGTVFTMCTWLFLVSFFLFMTDNSISLDGSDLQKQTKKQNEISSRAPLTRAPLKNASAQPVHCNRQLCIATVHCNRQPVHCNRALQPAAVHCNRVLQPAAVHCNRALQPAAVHCNRCIATCSCARRNPRFLDKRRA